MRETMKAEITAIVTSVILAAILVLALSPLASYASVPTQHPIIIGDVPDNTLLLILIIVVIAVAIAIADLVVYFKKLRNRKQLRK